MRSGRAVKVVIVTLILLVGGGALALAQMTGGGSSSKDAFKGSAMPPLFGDAQIAVVDAPLKAAEARGHRLAKTWLDAHPTATDAEFSAWAVQAIGPPPGATATKKELAQLRTLAAHRDPTGVTAAKWLESHGKKQPWKAILKQTKGFVPKADKKATKAALKDALALGKKIEDAAKARYDRRSPYVTDPSLNAGGVRVDVGGAHQSYPSSHTMDAGVGISLLSRLDPHLRSEYDWMADEVAYSRLYGGGHYLSDATAGMVLGTLVGDYERRKAGLAS